MSINVLNQKLGNNYAIYNADCVEVTADMPENIIDFIIYSPRSFAAWAAIRFREFIIS